MRKRLVFLAGLPDPDGKKHFILAILLLVLVQRNCRKLQETLEKHDMNSIKQALV
jgi:hypothetical protein